MADLVAYVPIVAVLSIYVARMAEVATKRAVIEGPVHEKLTFRLFMMSGLIAAFGGIAEYVLSGMHCRWEMLAAGVVLALASFVIRRAAIAALGKFWSLHIEIRENHQFVRSGPFRWMRHPTYFSMILELLSAIIILGTVWTAALAFLVFIPALVMRMSKEEAALVSKFGAEYQSYQRGTPILFPCRIP
ncbi:MAG TPA: isoprenylcysteine carboxylmethyltransferase family protein [Chthoniobacterales bacterium]|jgi:protein-S-isoprenylcysteine O-methyltransferase Ste14